MAASVSVCPSAVVEAPIERVWSLLSGPRGFDGWTDATWVSADSEGPLRPGQRLRMTTRGFGLTMDILEVDPTRHLLHLLVHLPLGLVNDETMTMAAVSDHETLVRFG